MKGFFSKYKLDLLIILILLCLILFSLNNTLQNAFIGGTNDLEVHAYNLWYLKESLVNYHKIPLWTSDHFGGKPFLGIYQPLVYYLLLPVSLIFSPIHVPKISFILIEIVAAIGFYLLMIKLFKSKLKALLGSSIFILAPHKLLTIAGGSLVQIAAMAFLPWMFLLYEKIKEKQKLQYLALLGLLTGLLLLSHHAVGGCFIVAVLLLMLYFQ